MQRRMRSALHSNRRGSHTQQQDYTHRNKRLHTQRTVVHGIANTTQSTTRSQSQRITRKPGQIRTCSAVFPSQLYATTCATKELHTTVHRINNQVPTQVPADVTGNHQRPLRYSAQKSTIHQRSQRNPTATAPRRCIPHTAAKRRTHTRCLRSNIRPEMTNPLGPHRPPTHAVQPRPPLPTSRLLLQQQRHPTRTPQEQTSPNHPRRLPGRPQTPSQRRLPTQATTTRQRMQQHPQAIPAARTN